MYAQNQAREYMPQHAAIQTAERVPELTNAVERLGNALARVDSLVGSLDGRLTGTVARSNPPQDTKAAGQLKGAMQTGFGSQLDGLHDAALSMEFRLQSLLERLEF